MARRRGKDEPIQPPKKRKRDLDDPAYLNEDAQSLDPPNQLVQATVSKLFPYPLLHAMRSTETGHAPAFVHEAYGADYVEYTNKPRLPPTWMDPQLFAWMCQQDPQVKTILSRAYAKNRRGPALKALVPLLDGIFEEQYLVRLLQQFAEVRGIFAQWLIANHTQRELNRERLAKEKKLKRLVKNGPAD